MGRGVWLDVKQLSPGCFHFLSGENKQSMCQWLDPRAVTVLSFRMSWFLVAALPSFAFRCLVVQKVFVTRNSSEFPFVQCELSVAEDRSGFVLLLLRLLFCRCSGAYISNLEALSDLCDFYGSRFFHDFKCCWITHPNRERDDVSP